MSAGRLGERERERKQRRTECCAVPAEWPRPLNPLIHQLSACSLEAGCTLPGEKNKKKNKNRTRSRRRKRRRRRSCKCSDLVAEDKDEEL